VLDRIGLDAGCIGHSPAGASCRRQLHIARVKQAAGNCHILVEGEGTRYHGWAVDNAAVGNRYKIDCRIGYIAGSDSCTTGIVASRTLVAEHYHCGRNMVAVYHFQHNHMDLISLVLGMGRQQEFRSTVPAAPFGNCLAVNSCTADHLGGAGRCCSNLAQTWCAENRWVLMVLKFDKTGL